MILKRSTLKFSKAICSWANLSACYLSVACATSLRTDQNPTKIDDFEFRIQFLRNKLCPDNLIRVLDDTQDLNSAVRIFKWAAVQRRFHNTADTYYWIIFKLGLAGNVKEMEGFCHSLVNDKIPGVEDAFISLIYAFVRHHRLNEAVRVLAHMNLGGYKPSVDVFDVLLGALVRDKRDFQDVLFVYKEMAKAGVLPNVSILNFLMEVLFETNRVEYALDQYRRMGKKGCSPNSRTFEIVIKGLIANRRVDESVMILNKMLELRCEPEFSFYITIIPLLCRENRVKEGFQLFTMMRASDLVPDLFVCGELMQCLCINLQVDDAADVLKEMLEFGETPAVDSFVDVVSCYCRLGRFDDAMNFLESKRIDVCSPYNVLLQGYCNAGKLFLAKSLLEKMIGRGIADCSSWNTLLKWICNNLDTRKAYEFLGRMIACAEIPNAATYSALIISKCKFNMFEDALKIFYGICSEFWVLDSLSYSKLVEGLCCVGKIAEAVEVFCYTSKHGYPLPSASFDMLISHVCSAWKVDEAIRLRWLAFCSGTPCNKLVYTTIMQGLNKSERAGDVLVFFAQMLVEGCELDVETYCILIRSMSALNRGKNCALLFNLMVDEGFVPDWETIRNVLYCLTKSCQLHTISAAIKKLISRIEVLDSAMFDVLINALWKEGSKMEAHQLLDSMLETGWVPDPRTHGLLVGSSVVEETTKGNAANKIMTGQDNVFDILAEGLGERNS